jgi:cytochrome c553
MAHPDPEGVDLMQKLAIALISLPLAWSSGVALAGDPVAGEAKAEFCLECHYSDDFAGLSAAEIEEKIRAARAGKFRHDAEIQDLAEEDIPDVAAWFAHEGAQ